MSKKIKKSEIRTGFTNCTPISKAHQMIYKKGFGVRCALCGKVSSDCTGQRINTPFKLN